MRWTLKSSAIGVIGLSVCLSWPIAGCDDAPGPMADSTPDQSVTAPEAPARPPPGQESYATLSPELDPIFRLIGHRRTNEARAALAAHLQQHPDDGRAEFLMGLSFHREKRYALAKPRFTRAVELEPNYNPTYHFLGWCLYYLGEMEPARRSFEQHLAHVPSEGDSHFALGLIDLDDDLLDDAEQHFVNAIELHRDNPRRRKDVSKAYARLADVHILRGDLEEAEAQLQTATELWPEHYTAFFKLYRVLTRLEEPEAAQEAFRLYKVWQERARLRRGVPERAP